MNITEPCAPKSLAYNFLESLNYESALIQKKALTDSRLKLLEIDLIHLDEPITPQSRTPPTNEAEFKFQNTVIQNLGIAFMAQQKIEQHLPQQKPANKTNNAKDIDHPLILLYILKKSR